MKNMLFFALILTFTACKTNSKAIEKETFRGDVTMEIHEIMTDSISIRALDYANGDYWYSGNDGKYGRIHAATGAIKKFQLTSMEARKMEYRSIAVTEHYTYLLSAGNPALIYKITQATDEVKLVYTELGDQVFYDSMKFWNDQEGIAFGDPTVDCLSIIKTIDGGETWTKSKCTDLPKFIKGEAAFAASNSNISIYKDNVWVVTGGAAARVLHSKDRGSTWDSYPTPIIAGGEMTGIYAIDFTDNKHGVLIGGDWNNKEDNLANKAISFDGGKNWKLMDAENGPGYCSDIVFIPETNGKEILAVGSQGIWWSGSQGEDWKKLTDQGFYTLKMINDKEGVLAGHFNVSKFILK
ncbi:oxidoreductase [Nonlabens sp. MB-3u-79]|uniref:WD40/YVTN/BNR-like repeat-containing protein n=1 Tax=Nonlabens sp. MB-3u-79 TaxID=2058134 RepID=UPI000C30657E|nr:oxidoreductase [Nonlabens sp. MB-3u-79]AUC79876.1 oxidoreductase [Nonlabens sp. MB-3u-79]